MNRSRPPAPARLGTFAALSYPNYRLWFFGQMVSLFGTWMQSTALGYLVYEITRSPAYLGYTGFASGLASWLFTLWGGVAADRVPRRNLLVATQTLSMLLAFVLSLDDFVITNFVSGQVQTFPIWVYGATKIGIPPQVNVMGTLLFVAGIVLALANALVQRARSA